MVWFFVCEVIGFVVGFLCGEFFGEMCGWFWLVVVIGYE